MIHYSAQVADIFLDKLHDPAHIASMQLLSVTEAAQRRQVDPATVRRWCISGALPARKIGSQWAIAVDDLDRFTPPPPGNPLLLRGYKKSGEISK